MRVSLLSFLLRSWLIGWGFLLIGCSPQSETQTLVLAHSLPVTHPVHQGIEDFRDLVREFSNGTIEVKIFPDGQLGSEREVVELLQIGSLDITKVSAAVMTSFAPAYEVLGLPYIFRDEQHRFDVLEGPIGDELLERGSSFWLRGLTFYDAGSRSFYTKDKAVYHPSDLKGLKIRVMNDQTSIQMVKALGGAATPMAYGELYTSLQQGVVDGAENNAPSFVSSFHHEVCKYYILDEHSAVPDVLVIGTKAWDRLDATQQQWLMAAADSSFQNQKKYWAASVLSCMEILEEAGVEVIRPEKSPFFEATESVRQQVASDPDLQRLVQRIQSHP